MKKTIRITVSLIIAAALILGSMISVFAAETIRGTDVTGAGSGSTLVLYGGEFKYLSKSDILARINELRLEACREGLRDPRSSSNTLKESDYVPIRWSSDLEWIAQTRAAEGSMYMSHSRPNGNNCFTAVHNGTRAYGEVLAWNWSADILGGIDQWYAEKEAWVNNTEGAVTGHYTSMINPSNKYVGIGAFKPSSGYGTVAGEFTSKNNLDETQAEAIGKCSQIVEVLDDRLNITVNAPEKIHVGENTQADVNMKAAYPDGVWSVSSNVKPVDKIFWSSADNNIATVNENGLVKGISAGDVSLTAAFGARSFSKEMQIEGHIWNSELTIVKKASCTEEGSGYIGCSVCGMKKAGSDAVIEKIPHSYGKWNITKNATCASAGTKTKFCTSCGKTIAETIPAKGHEWEKAYTVDKAATLSSAGSKSIHCSVCNAVKDGSSVSIAKLTLPAVKITGLTAAKKSMTVKWKKVNTANRKKIAGIDIQYSTSKNFKGGVKTVTAKKTATSKAIKKLKSKKKYYVRIRSYKRVKDSKYVSKWSAVKVAKTK